jgi:hypothetical protein
MKEKNVCIGCIYRETEGANGELIDGCIHDWLYNQNDDLIDKNNDVIVEYMLKNSCPLKEEERI